MRFGCCSSQPQLATFKDQLQGQDAGSIRTSLDRRVGQDVGLEPIAAGRELNYDLSEGDDLGGPTVKDRKMLGRGSNYSAGSEYRSSDCSVRGSAEASAGNHRACSSVHARKSSDVFDVAGDTYYLLLRPMAGPSQ